MILTAADGHPLLTLLDLFYMYSQMVRRRSAKGGEASRTSLAFTCEHQPSITNDSCTCSPHAAIGCYIQALSCKHTVSLLSTRSAVRSYDQPQAALFRVMTRSRRTASSHCSSQRSSNSSRNWSCVEHPCCNQARIHTAYFRLLSGECIGAYSELMMLNI